MAIRLYLAYKSDQEQAKLYLTASTELYKSA